MKAELFRISAAAILVLGAFGCSDSPPVGPPATPVVATVSILPATTFLQPGQSRQLVLEVRDSAGIPVPQYSARWSSDAPSVASVSASGVLTSLAEGSARITVTVDPISVTMTVGVTALTPGAARWEVLRSGGADASLLALWDDGAGTAWAGGTGGALLKSVDGGAWQRVPVATQEIIVSIWGASPTELWAVGSGGLLMRGNGATWEIMPPIMSRTLLFVWGLSANEVYASGDNGFIARWDGQLWSVMSTPTSNEIWAVGGTSRNDLWAVGNNGTILRNRGATAWEAFDSPSNQLLLGVWVAAPNNAFAVGTQGTVLRWDGDEWRPMATPGTSNLFAVWGRSGNEVYAAGNSGAFWKFDGATWQSIGIGSGQNLRAIAASSVDPGGVRLAGWYNAILSYRPGQRAKVELLDALFLSAWQPAAAGADAPTWVVGLGGSVGRRTSTGFEWLDVPAVNDLYGISGSGPNDIVAVGDTNAILRYNGTSWSVQSERTPILLRSVWTLGPNQHVIVGQGGRILRSSGNGWIPQASGTERFLRAVWGLDASTVFAVGDTGLLLRYDGERWKTEPTPTSVILRAVWGTSSNDVFLAGDRGVLLRWDGRRATPLPSPTTRDLRGLWGRSPTEVYAVGDSGTVLRYDGDRWRLVAAGTTAYLFGVTGSRSAAGSVTAVGARGTLIDGKP